MKAIRLVAVVAMMLASFSVWAGCPTQETTVVFMNGVWTTRQEAFDHMKKLRKAVYASGVSRDCVHFEYSHTQDDGKTGDIVEAIIQKSLELNIDLLKFVRVFFWLINADPALEDALQDILTVGYASELALIDAQTKKHLQKLQTLALKKGHRGIMVTHSQGGFYGNAVWERLTLEQKADSRIVAVVTPAAFVAGIGPNTRLSRDGVANRFFLAATAEGIVNNETRACQPETELKEHSWPCHGFDTGYLHDPQARAEIVADMRAALPEDTPQGGDVQWLSFVEGDPGLPGDGRTIDREGGRFDHLFELQPEFPLRGIRNGMTITAFPLTELNLSEMRMEIIFTVEGVSFFRCRGGPGWVETIVTRPVNGVRGIAISVPQSVLEGAAEHIRRTTTCTDATLDGLRLYSVQIDPRVFDEPFVRTLDAFAVGLGENAVP